MERKKSIKADHEPKSTHFLQIGLICSLLVMLFLLVVMYYFSNDDNHNTALIDIPVELGMAKEIKQMNLEKQQPITPQETISIPQSNLLEEISNNVIVYNDIAIDTNVKIKTDTLKNKIPGKGFEAKPEEEVKDSLPLSFVEDKPSFPGGADALLKFLRENVKYPAMAKEAGFTGTVIISFLIEKDGTITNIKIVNSISGGCNEEAIRVVKLMPKWIPAKQKGKSIRSQFQIPLFFYLSAN